MDQRIYKKMAGTSAAVVPADLSGPSPIERDGLAWTELSMPSSRQVLKWKPPIDSALALEGLEDYKPPAAGDARYVANPGTALVYIGKIRGWVAISHFA
jgi:hypothetical protein